MRVSKPIHVPQMRLTQAAGRKGNYDNNGPSNEMRTCRPKDEAQQAKEWLCQGKQEDGYACGVCVDRFGGYLVARTTNKSEVRYFDSRYTARKYHNTPLVRLRSSTARFELTKTYEFHKTRLLR